MTQGTGVKHVQGLVGDLKLRALGGHEESHVNLLDNRIKGLWLQQSGTPQLVQDSGLLLQPCGWEMTLSPSQEGPSALQKAQSRFFEK